MSIMKMYVEEYLNAEQVAENLYIIHLSTIVGLTKKMDALRKARHLL